MRFFTTLLLLFSFSLLKAQLELDWLFKIKNEADLSVTAQTLDKDNNLLSTGHFQGTIDFDPGPDTMSITADSSGSNYILKTDTSGKPIWVYKIDFTIREITVSPFDKLIFMGIYKDTADFDLGDSVVLLVSPTPQPIRYLACYDKELALNWIRIYPKLNDQGATKGGSIRTNSKGDVYFTGTFNDSVDFDYNTFTSPYKLKADRYGSTFLTKIDSAGKFLWAIMPRFSIEQMEIDKDDQLALAGRSADSTDFDLDSTIQSKNKSSYYGRPYVAKYDDQEKLMWSKSFYTSGTEGGGSFIRSMSIDDSSHIYIAGGYPDSIAFPTDSIHYIGLKSVVQHDSRGDERNGYIVKLNKNGDAQWAKSFSSSKGTSLKKTIAHSIFVDHHFQVHTLAYFGFDTLLISKYDDAGTVLSIDSINNLKWTHFVFCKLLVDDYLGTYVSGFYYDGIVDFDPGPATFYDSATWSKTFLVRYRSESFIVGQIEQSEEIKSTFIYPNPSNGTFKIQSTDNGSIEVNIYRINGQRISHFDKHDGSFQEPLEQGFYIVTIKQANGQVSTHKLVVQ